MVLSANFAVLNIDYYYCFILCFTLTLIAVIVLFDDMLQRKKTNISNAYEMVKGLKKYIKDYSNISEYNLTSFLLWDYYYVYAVALGIKKI